MSADTAMVDIAVDWTAADHFSTALTMSPQKWELYRDEPGFKVACSRLMTAIGPSVFESLRGYAVLTIKPEGWIDGVFPRVTDFLERNGFEVVGTFRSQLTPIMIRDIWRHSWNVAAVERIELSELLLSLGPTYGFLLRDTAPVEGVPASVRLARIKGPALSERQVPGQLRHELRAPCRIVTYVHIPDEPADIIRDLSVLLEPGELVRLLASTLEAEPARLDLDLATPADAARVDDALPGVGPVCEPGDSLWRRVHLMKAAFARHVEGARLPRTLWRDMLELCTEVSALPTPGAKRVEPLADVGLTGEAVPAGHERPSS
ncbi:hypothetical protein [Spirillospora sp. NPDC047279]|uniref:hypothetical protein n=1 Tax=Spirillospora sp. NPDC047279 TaxID=3155478 RepID=UPI0033C79F18